MAGWVRNRADGAVEAELEGAAEDVEVLVSWFRHGPSDAHVDQVEVEELTPAGRSRVSGRALGVVTAARITRQRTGELGQSG